jgi:hypothetical protein
MSKIFAVGQYDTSGTYAPYTAPIEVFRLGKSLRDSDGFTWAVLDDYDEWVSPTLRHMGLKSKVEIIIEAQDTDELEKTK